MMIKNYLFIFACLFPAITYSSDFHWDRDGTVCSGKEQIVLNIDAIGDGIEYNNALFLVGAIGKPHKSEIYYAMSVSHDLRHTQYWEFDARLQQVFVYLDSLYILNDDGKLFQWSDSKWLISELKLKPQSHVVFSKDDLVACYPSNITKADAHIGGCYSIEKNWHTLLDWSVAPQVCGEQLVSFDYPEKKQVFKKINLSTGDVISSKPIVPFLQFDDIPDDLCSSEF